MRKSTHPTEVDREARRGLDVQTFVRWVIFLHVLGAVLCGLFSHLDRQGQLRDPLEPLQTLLLGPALLSSLVCPVLIVGAIVRGLHDGRLGRRDAVTVCIAEVVIECGQFIALLPSVS